MWHPWTILLVKGEGCRSPLIVYKQSVCRVTALAHELTNASLTSPPLASLLTTAVIDRPKLYAILTRTCTIAWLLIRLGIAQTYMTISNDLVLPLCLCQSFGLANRTIFGPLDNGSQRNHATRTRRRYRMGVVKETIG